MPDNRLCPRLPWTASEARWTLVATMSVAEMAKASDTMHENAIFAATGGRRVEEPELGRLRAAIVEAASRYGYPESLGTEAKGTFDVECARTLHDRLDINSGEAARDEMWSFIGLVLLPDVARWRFPAAGKERFQGGVRNTFQRLWWRARVLHNAGHVDPYHLLAELTEDALVGIMERPGISSNRKVALRIGLELVAASSECPAGSREEFWRCALKRIRHRIPVLSFDALDEENLAATVTSIVRAVPKPASAARS